MLLSIPNSEKKDCLSITLNIRSNKDINSGNWDGITSKNTKSYEDDLNDENFLYEQNKVIKSFLNDFKNSFFEKERENIKKHRKNNFSSLIKIETKMPILIHNTLKCIDGLNPKGNLKSAKPKDESLNSMNISEGNIINKSEKRQDLKLNNSLSSQRSNTLENSEIHYVLETNSNFKLLNRSPRGIVPVNFNGDNIETKTKISKKEPILNESLSFLYYEPLKFSDRIIYIIESDSLKKFYWDLFIFSLLVFSIFYVPFNLAFSFNNFMLIVTDIFIDFFIVLDLILSFFTSYHEEKEEDFILSTASVAGKYLFSWFLYDAISGMPINSVLNIMIYNGLKIGDYTLIMRFLRLFKLLKMHIQKFKKEQRPNMIQHLFDSISNNFKRIIYFILYFLLFNHSLACLWIYIGRTSNPSWISNFEFNINRMSEIYIAALYFNISTVFTIGYGDIYSVSNIERFFTIILMFGGIFIYALTIIFFSNIFIENTGKVSNQMNNKKCIEDLKIKYDIPESLESQIKDFLQFKFINSIKEDQHNLIFELPDSIKQSLVCEMYRNLVENFKFFRKINSLEFNSRVIMSLRPLRVFKNDNIVKAKDFIEELVFIQQGRLSLDIELNGNLIKISELHKNNHFGDVIMLLKKKSPVNIKVSSRFADLLLMSKNDFFKLFSEFSKIYKNIYNESYYDYFKIKKIIKKNKKKFKSKILNSTNNQIDQSLKTNFMNENEFELLYKNQKINYMQNDYLETIEEGKTCYTKQHSIMTENCQTLANTFRSDNLLTVSNTILSENFELTKNKISKVILKTKSNGINRMNSSKSRAEKMSIMRNYIRFYRKRIGKMGNKNSQLLQETNFCFEIIEKKRKIGKIISKIRDESASSFETIQIINNYNNLRSHVKKSPEKSSVMLNHIKVDCPPHIKDNEFIKLQQLNNNSSCSKKPIKNDNVNNPVTNCPNKEKILESVNAQKINNNITSLGKSPSKKPLENVNNNLLNNKQNNVPNPAKFQILNYYNNLRASNPVKKAPLKTNKLNNELTNLKTVEIPKDNKTISVKIEKNIPPLIQFKRKSKYKNCFDSSNFLRDRKSLDPPEAKLICEKNLENSCNKKHLINKSVKKFMKDNYKIVQKIQLNFNENDKSQNSIFLNDLIISKKLDDFDNKINKKLDHLFFFIKSKISS